MLKWGLRTFCVPVDGLCKKKKKQKQTGDHQYLYCEIPKSSHIKNFKISPNVFVLLYISLNVIYLFIEANVL